MFTNCVDNLCWFVLYSFCTRNVYEKNKKGGEKDMNKEQIAKTLLLLRQDKSREEVAYAVGISVSALTMYETGKRIPRDEIKLKLAKYYGKDIQSIFFNH